MGAQNVIHLIARYPFFNNFAALLPINESLLNISALLASSFAVQKKSFFCEFLWRIKSNRLSFLKKFGNDFQIKASVGHIRDLPQKKLGVDVDKNFEPAYDGLRVDFNGDVVDRALPDQTVRT